MAGHVLETNNNNNPDVINNVTISKDTEGNLIMIYFLVRFLLDFILKYCFKFWI